MSRAAIRKLEQNRWWTADEFLERVAVALERGVSPDQITAVIDELVDSGEIAVRLRDDTLWYRLAKESASRKLIERVAALVPSVAPITKTGIDVPILSGILERGRTLYGPGFVGDVDVAWTELEAARDELVAVLQQLNLPTARGVADNEGMREWATALLKQIRRKLREGPPGAAPDTDCVTCRTRARHFGPYCKRCCPPEQRPVGKVA